MTVTPSNSRAVRYPDCAPAIDSTTRFPDGAGSWLPGMYTIGRFGSNRRASATSPLFYMLVLRSRSDVHSQLWTLPLAVLLDTDSISSDAIDVDTAPTSGSSALVADFGWESTASSGTDPTTPTSDEDSDLSISEYLPPDVDVEKFAGHYRGLVGEVGSESSHRAAVGVGEPVICLYGGFGSTTAVSAAGV